MIFLLFTMFILQSSFMMTSSFHYLRKGSTSLCQTIKYCSTRTTFAPQSWTPLLLSSSQNDQIKYVKSLIQQKKRRDETGCIVLEGLKPISDMIQHHHTLPNTIYITEKLFHSTLYQSSIHQQLSNKIYFQDLKQKYYLVSEKVFDQISDTMQGQGIIAVFNKPSYTHYLTTPINNKAPLVLLLDRISDPGNMGTIIRTAYGLGVSGILAVDCCDVWSPKVLRSATGHCLNIPIIETTWNLSIIEEALVQYDKEYQETRSTESIGEWQILAADGDEANENYININYHHPTFLIIGSEAHGVSPNFNQLPSHRALKKIRIPMMRSVESLNAAVAASIILAEASKQRQT